MGKCVRIGSGAGFAGDRFDAALPVIDTLARSDGPKYLIYEVMGERTLAIAHQLKRENQELGYSTWLDNYLPHVLSRCAEYKIRIVANFGNANPRAAAQRVLEISASLGLPQLRVAVVEGDDLLAFQTAEQLQSLPTVEGTSTVGRELLGANAYLGARPVAQALALDVDIVLVGRTTDAALILGPLIFEHQWAPREYDLLAAGTVAGHLLECGGQVTGGYFADPGYKEVPDLYRLGFPIAEIEANGEFIITKADSTGGVVNRATVIEQLLYEVHNPRAYLTPDVTVDLSGIQITDVAANRLKVTGAIGHPPPETLKATLCVDGGWLGESEISYAGPNALARARLAVDTVRARLQILAIEDPCRIEIIGTGTVHSNDIADFSDGAGISSAGEYRVRAAIRTQSREDARRLTDEILALYCCGPAAGGGVRQSVTPQVSTASVLIDRQLVEAQTTVEEIQR